MLAWEQMTVLINVDDNHFLGNPSSPGILLCCFPVLGSPLSIPKPSEVGREVLFVCLFLFLFLIRRKRENKTKDQRDGSLHADQHSLF